MMRSHLFSQAVLVACVLALAAFSTGCDTAEPSPPLNDSRFQRYAAIGGSITAGMQAEGLTYALQQDAYPVLLAEQIGTPFALPALQDPGCPPPITNALTGERADNMSCALRQTPIPATINNFAVPGATLDRFIVDRVFFPYPLPYEVDPDAAVNELTTLILGGRTPIDAAREDVYPTFSTQWIGNDDIAIATAVGDTSTLPSAMKFQDALFAPYRISPGNSIRVELSVIDPTLLPHLIPGSSFFTLEENGAFPPTLSVNDNCASSSQGGIGDQMRVPFKYGIRGLFRLAREGRAVELNCTDNRPLREVVGGSLPDDLDPLAEFSILTPEEVQHLKERVEEYNEFLNFISGGDKIVLRIDVNPTFRALYNEGTETPDPFDDAVPKFPILPDAETPNPDTFGSWYSLDGVHPSSRFHQVIANLIIESMNEEEDLPSIPPIPGASAVPGS